MFVILGGNDCNSAWDTKEICSVQNSCKDFAVICRNAFPNAKLIFFQVEDRYDPTTWEINLDHKRKGNKFNKWLNKFEGKAALINLKGQLAFSTPYYYTLDKVHLNEVGNLKLAALIQQYYDCKKAGHPQS